MKVSLPRMLPPALAAVAGVSVWVSLGQSAVLDESSARVASMPPLWWVGALVVAAVAAAMATRLSLSRAWPLALSLLVWLPYLPMPVPAAFLMWQGPLEGLVWMAVAAGMLVSGPLPAPGIGAFSNPRRAPLLAAAIAAVAYTAGAWSLADLLPGGDEPHYLVTVQSLLLDGDLRIENNHDRGDYRSYTDQPLKPDFIQRGVDGEIYPMHSPGTSMLVLPGFALAGYAGAAATIIALAAAASALTWQAAWLLTASVSGAWAGWVVVFLTTPFFFHGFTIYPDGVAGLFTMAGVWLLVMMEAGRPVATRHLVASGAALAVLPWLHARFALIAAALGAAIVLRLVAASGNGGAAFKRTSVLRRLTAFLALPVIVAASWFLYFWIIWGTPNPSAPQGRDLMMSAGQIWVGAAGLLFDQQFGLVPHAPAYAIALIGLIPLARRHPRLSIELLLASAPYVIATASFAAWWGGVSAPARYLAALAPMAALPVALWWHDRSSMAWRSLTALAIGLSVAMVIPSVAVDGGLLAYNDRAGFDLLLEWASRAVDLPMAFPSLHRQSLAAATLVAGVWVVAGAMLGSLAWALTPRSLSRGVTWTISAAAAAAALMAAATIVWAGYDLNAVRPGPSQWTFLTSWRPSAGQFAFQSQPARRLRPEELARRLEVRSFARTAADSVSAPVLRAARLPAGDYELVTGGEGPLQGEVLVQVGRTELLMERWRLDGRQPGFAGFSLRLPVPVHSVTVRADHAALATAREFRLRVRSLAPVPPAGFALRAIRYGRTRVFFMDDSSYMEAEGFWTRGEEATTIVLDTEQAGAGAEQMLLVRSGAVPTTIDVAVGTWRRRLGFAANQLQAVSLPAQDGPRVVTIRSGPWFRPSDHEPGSRDTRRLGVFVTVP